MLLLEELIMDKEYSLAHKQHKELFPYRKHKFGMIKYRYFDNGNIGIKIVSYYTPLIYLWILVMFIPSIFVVGVPETIEGIKYLCSKKQHLSIDYVGVKTETYKKFMKYAKVKK